MTNRATMLAPRIFVATMMASAALVTVELYPANAADECVTKPGEAPAGKHWFYRSDRVTKRQCWYLRDSDTTSQGASLAVRKSAAAAAHKNHAALSASAANAHAELSSPSADDDVKATSSVAAPAMLSTRAAPAAPQPSPAPEVDTSIAVQRMPDRPAVDPSAIASRWPDSAAALPPAEPLSRSAAVEAPPPAASMVVAAATPAPAADAGAITPETAAQMSVSEMETPATPSLMRADDPARTRLMMFLCAVALVGFSSSMLLAKARRRRIRLEPVHAGRAIRWPAEPEIDHMRLPTVDEYYPALIPVGDTGARAVKLSIVPRDEEPRDEQSEVEDLLARYSGQARTDR